MMLDRLLGNEALKDDWRAAIAANRLPHALLLAGETGSGTGFAARCLAADVLYPAGGPHAEAVVNGVDTECVTLRGSGASGQIKVDDVRDACAEICRSALGTDARGRALFLYGAQNLNPNSSNALLKTLEEPPRDVLVLLTANSTAAVLPTIRSRCAAYTLAPVPLESCAAALREENNALSQEQAEDLAFLCGGLLGTARRALQNPEQKALLQRAAEICRSAARRDAYRVQALLSGVERERETAGQLLDWLDLLCGAALRRPGFASLDPERAAAIRQADQQARFAIQRNGNLRLLLCVAGIQMTRA